MDKELYLRELYSVHTEFKNLKKEILQKWPSGPPPYDSPENEEWYKDLLAAVHKYPAITFGFFYAQGGNEFIGRKPLWLDPAFEYRKRIEECVEKHERDEIVFKFRREWGRLMFESVKMAIPIYPDTTKEDIEKLWPRIEKFKEMAYGEALRPKKKKFLDNIAIYQFGRMQEEYRNLTGRSGTPWTIMAQKLGISPQACKERYESIKRLLSLHLAEEPIMVSHQEVLEIMSENFVCEACPEKDICAKTGSCVVVDRLEPEISLERHASIESSEARNARKYGHWQAEDEFINSTFGESEE